MYILHLEADTYAGLLAQIEVVIKEALPLPAALPSEGLPLKKGRGRPKIVGTVSAASDVPVESVVLTAPLPEPTPASPPAPLPLDPFASPPVGSVSGTTLIPPVVFTGPATPTTFEDMKAALQGIAKIRGKESDGMAGLGRATGALSRFGYRKIKEVKPEHFHLIVEACKNV
jgi:hypothetical protein